MIAQHLRLLALFTVAVSFGAACSSSPDVAETTTTTPVETTTTVPATTTIPVTTTTAPPLIEVSDAINGLPADQELLDRRIVAVKIDNHLEARPQSGLESADAVYEVLVESDLTRFIALFHQTDLDYVGPTRSGRVTDSKVMAALGGAPFQISGAQDWVKDIYKADGVNVVYDTGDTTFRTRQRPRPHNLFASTLLLRAWADKRGWPDEHPGPLFAFGEPTPGEADATKIEISFSEAPPSTWVWNGERYLRFHGATPHNWADRDGNSGQVAFDTLVVMKMRKYIARDPAGLGASLPTVRTAGKGEAFVFFNGQVVGGAWERGSKTDPFFLTTFDGSEMILPPGRVWISLVPDDQTVTWE